MHTPVFHKEVLEALEIAPGKRYIDCTAGEGGHLFTMAEQGGVVLGIDYDADQIALLQKRNQYDTVTLLQGNFNNIQSIASKHGFGHVNGILADFGLSMRQYRESGKGLSYKQLSERLTMRLSDNSKSVVTLLNEAEPEELERIFELYGEEIYSHELAADILDVRSRREISTVNDLNSIIVRVANQKNVTGGRKEQMIARIYQALRIEVNEEMDNIKAFLEQAPLLLVPGGRLVMITFHSLEDRIVKRWGQSQKDLKSIKVRLTKQERRSFERSAQLRVFEKIS
jgi:16S rRNA (cytosine1402-N4)-methyltransferase